MSRWKYKIELQYINKGEKPISIKYEHIHAFYKDNNYKKNHTPTMHINLTLDKNLYDKILLTAKNAAMMLTVYKFDADSSSKSKIIVYNDLCDYFVNNDVNYNKEIDYAGKNKDREDIFRNVNIGLMFKKCIEYNKQTNNTTIKNSTMMNAVAYYLRSIPILIEPFTYNDTIKQLVVPPQDTLYKTVCFFNNVKVFYDTSFRMYYEPDCLYIVSSSGKGTPRKSDLHPTVRFTIRAVDDPFANVLGMQEGNNDCYAVDVNVVNTVYNMDNTTGKIYNEITSIINPSLSHSLTTLGAVQNVMQDISNISSNIRNTVKRGVETIKDIPDQLNQTKIVFRNNIDNSAKTSASAVSNIQSGMALIAAMPDHDEVIETKNSSGEVTSSKTIKGLAPEKKKKILGELQQCCDSITLNNKLYQQIVPCFDGESGKVIGSLGGMCNMGSFLNCVSSINAQDNIPALQKSFYKNYGKITKISEGYEQNLKHFPTKADSLASNCSKSITLIESSGIEQEKIASIIASLSGHSTVFNQIASSTSIHLGKYGDIPIDLGHMNDGFKPFVKKLTSGFHFDLKGLFTQFRTDVATLGHEAKSMLKEITKRGQQAIDDLRENGINFSTISELRDNINAIRNLDSIGRTGLSKFSVKLNLGQDNPSGRILYKITNDNANKIKNLKADIENKENTLTLTKNDLDVSVLNINMEYIIKNYDAHSNCDGRFLLDRKFEMYSREGDAFKCTTQLEFSKIAADKGGKAAAQQNIQEQAESIVGMAEDVFHSIKDKDFSLDSITSNMRKINQIESTYRNMANSMGSNAKVNKDILMHLASKRK